MSKSGIPVETLSYFERTPEALVPVARWLALAAIVQGGISVLSFTIRAGFWEWSLMSKARAQFSTGWMILLDLPLSTVGALLITGGILVLRRQSAGRGLLAVSSLTYVIVSLVVAVLLAGTYLWDGTFARSPFGPGFVGYQFSNIFFAAVQRGVLPAVLWAFFQSAAAREMFAATDPHPNPLS